MSTMRTYDGKHSIGTIDLTVVYLVPKGRTPLADWRERVDYYLKRVEAFHRREFDGQSAIRFQVHPRPLLSAKTPAEIRGDEPDRTFYNSMDEARKGLNWPPAQREGFPILLVLSEINWRELDDFRRVITVDGKERHEGNVNAEGRHFPGAEAGGARATYQDEPGLGMGLVSADGWRVPYIGSDCPVYHEGLGHTVGIPHPEPVDDSVMGVAQYLGWLNQTFITESQKRQLGWKPGRRGADRQPTLFDKFTALSDPPAPRPGQAVDLKFTWPDGARVRDLRVRWQTSLGGPWQAAPACVDVGTPGRLALGRFEKATPVSYRVTASLEDGQEVELWGYFQVK